MPFVLTTPGGEPVDFFVLRVRHSLSGSPRQSFVDPRTPAIIRLDISNPRNTPLGLPGGVFPFNQSGVSGWNPRALTADGRAPRRVRPRRWRALRAGALVAAARLRAEAREVAVRNGQMWHREQALTRSLPKTYPQVTKLAAPRPTYFPMLARI